MEVTEKIITDMVSAFQSELDEENIKQASILQKAATQLPELQSIGEKVFRRWVRLIKLNWLKYRFSDKHFDLAAQRE